MKQKYDLVEEDNVLILALYKQEKMPVNPAFYLYPIQEKMMLERGVADRLKINLDQASVATIKKYRNIFVTETSIFDSNDFISYTLPIQIINDPNLKI